MRLRTSYIVLIMAAAPYALQAGNPQILIKGDPPNPTILVSNSFTFGADNFGGGVLSFQNESGQNWSELSVTATLPNLTPITCGPGPFITCTIATSPVSGGFLYDIMFGPAAASAITNGEVFSVNLNNSGDDPNGVGDWGPGTDFSGKADATPEPSSIMLVFAGGVLVGCVFLRRRRAA